MSDGVRVRFSPSPTGDLHVGTARTALFNWLFARHARGTFVLRIEDTDLERSDERHERTILEDLAWLGLAWDEGPDIGGPFGPYRQSQRAEQHREAAEKLLAAGRAYPCYCSVQELAARREEALTAGTAPKYDGRCRDLSEAERERREAEGRTPTIRYRVEPGTTTVHDLIRGDIVFDHNVVSDFVLLGSDGMASYNFAVTVDDDAMRITHVIRGDDHLTNTVRQLMLYRDMGLEPPAFAHLSMITDASGGKLSKRRGAVGIGELRVRGFLAEAVTNYLSLLGWSHPEGKDVFSLDEAAALFELGRVSKSPAIFDLEKLTWLNASRIRALDSAHLTRLLRTFATGTPDLGSFNGAGKLEEFVGATQESVKVLSDFVEHARIYTKPVGVPDKAAQAELRAEAADAVIAAAKEILAGSGELDEAGAKAVLGDLRERMRPQGVSGRRLFMPLRAALTGTTSGPELYHVLSIIGRDEAVARLEAATRRQ